MSLRTVGLRPRAPASRIVGGLALVGALLAGPAPLRAQSGSDDAPLVLPLPDPSELPPSAALIPIRTEGNVVLIEEVYATILSYAGWDQAPTGAERGPWIERTLEDFLHASGYELATVDVEPVDGGGFRLTIDEGRLDKIIFRNVDPWTTVQLIFLLDLPGKVFNRDLVNRRLQVIRERMNVGDVRYEVVPTEEPEYLRLQLKDPRIIEGLTLLAPGEPHELRVSFETVERSAGFELGLGVQAPDGLVVEGTYLLPGVLVSEDRLEVGARLGVRLTDIGQVPGNRIGLSRAGGGLEWASPPVFDVLRFTSKVSAEVEARPREDLRLVNYFFAPINGGIGLALELSGFRIGGRGGFEQRTFFGARAEEGVDEVPILAPEQTEQNNLRSYVEAELDWIFNPERLRRDRPHEISFGGRIMFPMAGASGVIREARLRYRNTVSFGFEELRYQLKGAWLEGAPFYSEVPMGEGFLRSAFQGEVFARRVGSVNLEYRLSLSRDLLKFSLFNDVAVYDALDELRDSQGLAVIDNFGLGLHVLLLDAFQADAYVGVGIRDDGATDFGVSLSVAQAY